MRRFDWRVGRVAYGFCLGLLVVVACKLHSPVGGLVAFALFGAQFSGAAHSVALFALGYMAIGAGISFGPRDPMSPKVALAREVLAKGAQVLRAAKTTKAHGVVHRREAALLSAILAEKQAYVAANGHARTPEREELDRRFAANWK